MTALAVLQAALQERVLRGGRMIEPLVAGDPRDVGSRLAVYEHAFRARLTEALAASYPVLRKLLGNEAFEAAASACIASEPPTQASIRWYGAHLHRQLGAKHEELARWEWLLAEVFDAADDTAMTAADLAAVAAADWPALRLRLHRTVRFFESKTNAVACWKAASEGAPAPAPVSAAPMSWVVWRRDLTVLFRSTPPDEARALADLARGATFAALCEGLADGPAQGRDTPVRAASLLQEWIGQGLIGQCAFYPPLLTSNPA